MKGTISKILRMDQSLNNKFANDYKIISLAIFKSLVDDDDAIPFTMPLFHIPTLLVLSSKPVSNIVHPAIKTKNAQSPAC